MGELGGGSSARVGDYESSHKIGCAGLGRVQLGLPVLIVQLPPNALLWPSTPHDMSGVAAPGTTKLYGGLANVVYSIGPDVMMRPYVLGGIGIYHVTVDVPGTTGDETRFAFGVGGGVSVGVGRARLFVEGRFVSVRESGGSTSFVPFTAGGTFGEEDLNRRGGGGVWGRGAHIPTPPLPTPVDWNSHGRHPRQEDPRGAGR